MPCSPSMVAWACETVSTSSSLTRRRTPSRTNDATMQPTSNLDESQHSSTSPTSGFIRFGNLRNAAAVGPASQQTQRQRSASCQSAVQGLSRKLTGGVNEIDRGVSTRFTTELQTKELPEHAALIAADRNPSRLTPRRVFHNLQSVQVLPCPPPVGDSAESSPPCIPPNRGAHRERQRLRARQRCRGAAIHPRSSRVATSAGLPAARPFAVRGTPLPRRGAGERRPRSCAAAGMPETSAGSCTRRPTRPSRVPPAGPPSWGGRERRAGGTKRPRAALVRGCAGCANANI